MQTEPGLPRPYYTGHANTEALVAEARQRFDRVMFSVEPGPSALNIRQIPGQELPLVMHNTGIIPRQNSSQLTFITAPPSQSNTPDPLGRNSQRYSQIILSPEGTSLMQLPEVTLGGVGGLGMTPMLGSDNNFPPQSPRSPPPGSVMTAAVDPYQYPVPQTAQSQPMEMSEFGVYQFSPRSSSLRNEQPSPGIPSSPRDGRYGTFPLKATGGPRPQPGASASSSSSLPPRLDERAPSIEVDRSDLNDSFSSSVAEALGQQWVSDGSGSASSSSGGKAYEAKMHVRNRDYSPPPPQYSAIPEESSSAAPDNAPTLDTDAQASTSHNPFDEQRTDLEEEAGLAYMVPDPVDHTSHPHVSEHTHEDRRVRFGVPDTYVDSNDEVTPQPSRQPTADDGSALSLPLANHDGLCHLKCLSLIVGLHALQLLL